MTDARREPMTRYEPCSIRLAASEQAHNLAKLEQECSVAREWALRQRLAASEAKEQALLKAAETLRETLAEVERRQKVIPMGVCLSCGQQRPLIVPQDVMLECGGRDKHGAPCGGEIVQYYVSDEENDEIRQELTDAQATIARLAQVTETDALRVVRDSRDRILQEFCNLQITYGQQKHRIRDLEQQVARLENHVKAMQETVSAETVDLKQQVARLRGYFVALDRLSAAHKIQDLDAHAIIDKAFRETGA